MDRFLRRTYNNLFAAIFIFIVPVFLASLYSDESLKTKNIQIGLNDDGSLTDESNGPSCGDGHKIRLLKYGYLDEEDESHLQELRPADTLLLHQKCSLRDKCDDLRFPSRPNNANRLFISYQCIDGKNLRDMCENFTMPFNETFYLTVIDRQRIFQQCQCSVNSSSVNSSGKVEKFLVTLSDIRLLDKTKGECCPAELFVYIKKYRCEKHEEDFGSVFNQRIEGERKDMFITVKPMSNTTLPEAILVAFEPVGRISMRVTCRVKNPVTMKSSSPATDRPSEDRTTNEQTIPTRPDTYESGTVESRVTYDQVQRIIDILEGIFSVLLSIPILLIIHFLSTKGYKIYQFVKTSIQTKRVQQRQNSEARGPVLQPSDAKPDQIDTDEEETELLGADVNPMTAVNIESSGEASN